jgi:hypothetical protein
MTVSSSDEKNRVDSSCGLFAAVIFRLVIVHLMKSSRASMLSRSKFGESASIRLIALEDLIASSRSENFKSYAMYI